MDEKSTRSCQGHLDLSLNNKPNEKYNEKKRNCCVIPKLMVNGDLLIGDNETIYQETSPKLGAEDLCSFTLENGGQETGTQRQSCNSESVPEPKLMCRICEKPFEDPRILPCLHTFCANCIDQLKPYIPTNESTKTSLTNRTRIHFPSNKKQKLKTDQSSLPSTTSNSTAMTLSLIETKTVLCPICDSEVDLQFANCLPINYIVQKQLPSYHVQLSCDVCTYKSPVTSRCEDCDNVLCMFCTEAHKRQRKTGGHIIIKLKDQTSDKEDFNKKFASLQCMHHPNEDLKLFCEDCLLTVCCVCADGSHRNHSCRFVTDVSDHQISRFQDEMTKLQHYVDNLKKTIQLFEPTTANFNKRVNETTAEINEFIDSYIRALQLHKQNLLNEIKKAEKQKNEYFTLQKIQLQQTVEDLETSFRFSNDLLQIGSDIEILSMLGTVMQRFHELESININKRKDDIGIMLDKSQTVRVNGLPLLGSIVTRSPPLFKFIVKGDGLLTAREGQWAEVYVTCKDVHGNSVILDDDYIKVTLTERDQSGRCIPVQITNYKNGLHKLCFYPMMSGFFLLHITSFGEPIQGSPFLIPIKSKWKSHSGTFHCCSFCSSNGSKDAICACGGSMPGGYKGCGHGHRNHPGHKHWSCCGKTIENSECTRKPSVFYTFTI